MFQYEAKMLRVVDGDTVWLDIDLGFRISLQVDVRLAHINAPERVNFTLQGLQDHAMNYIQQCLPPGATCVVEIVKPDKYARWLGTLYYLKNSTDRMAILAAGQNLNDELVRQGFAKRYL